MDIAELSVPLELVGRQAQFQQITRALACTKDLLVAGVPGSGRRTLVRRAAAAVGAKVVEVDCIRATDGQRLIHLICEGISQAVKSEGAIAFLQEWVREKAAPFFAFQERRITLLLNLQKSEREKLWQAYQMLLEVPQQLAESVGRQVIIILHGFPHIRSWDRNRDWEKLLRSEIERQEAVSYVLVATLAEASDRVQEDWLDIKLTPLADDVVAAWAQDILNREGLTFDPRSQALERFLQAVGGHIGDASTLVRRLRTAQAQSSAGRGSGGCFKQAQNGLINNQTIEQTIQEVLSDLSTTFEALLMLLPASQAQLLESLALDPADKPQSREYIDKHHLSRGGSLQGAIAGLQQKGLIYGAEHSYQVALPLFALWIRQRLR